LGGSEEQQKWRGFVLKVNAGGCAGVLSWIMCMPFDNIKVVQQTAKKQISMTKVAKKLYKEGGIKRFWKGS